MRTSQFGTGANDELPLCGLTHEAGDRRVSSILEILSFQPRKSQRLSHAALFPSEQPPYVENLDCLRDVFGEAGPRHY